MDDGVDIRQRNGCLADRAIWTMSIQKQKQQVRQLEFIHRMREVTLDHTHVNLKNILD